MASISLFIFVQFWYFYQETEQTSAQVNQLSQSYDARIRSLANQPDTLETSARDEIVKLSFLKEFKNQMTREQSHERVNRRYSTFTAMVEWFILLFVLFLAVLNERATAPEQSGGHALKRSTSLLLVFFAALSIAVPAATQKLGFDARQRLHDFRAQQLGILIVELESGAIDSRQAWQRYRGFFRLSPSAYAETQHPG